MPCGQRLRPLQSGEMGRLLLGLRLNATRYTPPVPTPALVLARWLLRVAVTIAPSMSPSSRFMQQSAAIRCLADLPPAVLGR